MIATIKAHGKNDITVNLDVPEIAVEVSSGIIRITPEPYQGTYNITPSQERQTLPTTQKYLDHNVVIEPIPEYYGRIAYNGITLTVS